MLVHWKTTFDRYYCIKTEIICYISRYFLHYFVSPFHRCLANEISTDYARSSAGQNISRDGSNSVAPVQAYWKLRSRAFTARELLIHGFSPVNARLLITCGTAFYAIMLDKIHVSLLGTYDRLKTFSYPLEWSWSVWLPHITGVLRRVDLSEMFANQWLAFSTVIIKMCNVLYYKDA